MTLSLHVKNTQPLDYFDDRPVKQKLEDLLYSYVGYTKGMVGNVMQVTGPAIKRHLTNARKIASTSACKIYWVEIEHSVYNTMQSRLRSLGRHAKKNVYIGQGDVTNYEHIFGRRLPCRFEDIDFCQSIQSTKYIVAHRMQIQSVDHTIGYKKKYKCMLVTASIRPLGTPHYFKCINIALEIIGAEIDVGATMRNGAEKMAFGGQKWRVSMQKKGRLSDFMAFSYNDTSNMISCMILYK